MTLDIFDLRDELDAAEEVIFSPRATKSCSALRRRKDQTAEKDHRQNFAIDADRILHSLAYTRYIDKTQVFYLVKNDHITHRVLHVQLVSRIARTIGRHLKLNEDLIEAIALGHDLGHAPFGHDGETYLSRLCQNHGIGHFVHAVQSVEFLERIEKKGRGLNLSLQVLDGILAHDGEVDIPTLAPDPNRSFTELDRLITEKRLNPRFPIAPMTTEGCVVRLADTISYIGRDLEDAIRLGLVRREEVPRDCTLVLGDTNGKIIYTLVSDLIATSRNAPVIAFSSEKAAALKELKNFNRQRIYYNPIIKTDGDKIENLFQVIFQRLLACLETEKKEIPLFIDYLNNMSSEYRTMHRPEEIVRDFIAGMTDAFFMELGQDLLLPRYRREGFSYSSRSNFF
ncbi:MAG: HD domain-containing protein [Deltaproteobacteria bacterium]|nr:HD domain-containing protein [Deltaproteobacteria bacterium]